MLGDLRQIISDIVARKKTQMVGPLPQPPSPPDIMPEPLPPPRRVYDADTMSNDDIDRLLIPPPDVHPHMRQPTSAEVTAAKMVEVLKGIRR